MGRIVVTPNGKTFHVGGRVIKPNRRQMIHLGNSRFGLDITKFPPLPQETRFAQAPAAQQCLTNVLKNDTEGCCTQADKFHRQALRQAAGGAALAFTPSDTQVEAAYTRDGGQPGDQGCDEQVVMTNEQTIGDPCGPGTGADGSNIPIDKSLGFVVVDATNVPLVQQCVATFVGGSICMGLPDDWVRNMPSTSGWTWGLPKGGAPSGYFDPQNGHCFSLYDFSTASSVLFGIGSWGMFGFLTPDALAAGAVESNGGALYFVIDQQILSKAACVAPDGADWATIQSDFTVIGGTVTP